MTAAFFYINSLGDKISNTAAPIQRNPFWFWENLIIYVPVILLHLDNAGGGGGGGQSFGSTHHIEKNALTLQ